MKQVATTIFKFRLHVLIFLALVTLFLGYHAGHLEVATDFTKMVPQEHEYMENYRPFKKLFGGGNQIRVSVARSEKTILDPDFLKKFRKINEDVFFTKGIDRRTVRSMVSPETVVVFINEEGFNVAPVVPHSDSGDRGGDGQDREEHQRGRAQGSTGRDGPEVRVDYRGNL